MLYLKFIDSPDVMIVDSFDVMLRKITSAAVVGILVVLWHLFPPVLEHAGPTQQHIPHESVEAPAAVGQMVDVQNATSTPSLGPYAPP